MQSIQDAVENEIIDVLTKYGPLSYRNLFLKLKKTKNDRTFRKSLYTLIINKILKRKKSKDDHRKIIYSIRGFEFESVNLRLSEYGLTLSKYENDLINHMQKYLEYSKLESNKTELEKHRLKLAKSVSVLLGSIFELNQTILFLKLIHNAPLLRKTENFYKIHLKRLHTYLDLLRKHDLETFKQTIAVFVLKSGISIPGLI